MQRRLDAARARIAEGERIADQEIFKITRSGLSPLDTGASALDLFSGEGDWGDALNVASSIPLVGTVGKFGKFLLPERIAADAAVPAARTVQLGGAHWKVRRLKPGGYQPHHIPANSANGLNHGEGPAIAMRAEHHRKTASHSAMPGSRAYLARQRDLIRQGKFREAVEMDIYDIRTKFGNEYDDAIEQMLDCIKRKGY